MWHDEGLVQGSPTSSSGLSFSIHNRVKEAVKRLAAEGGCARFRMDDGYMVGPKDLIFDVVRQFATRVKANTGCGLNVRKCKMYNINAGECQEAGRRGLIPEELNHLEEGKLQLEEGETYGGIPIFNVPIGKDEYVAHVLRYGAE